MSFSQKHPVKTEYAAKAAARYALPASIAQLYMIRHRSALRMADESGNKSLADRAAEALQSPTRMEGAP